MGLWSLGLGAIGAALAGLFLANTDLCLPKVAEAQLEYLEDADLRSTTDGGCSLYNQPQLWLKTSRELLQQRNQSVIIFFTITCVGVARNRQCWGCSAFKSQPL